MSIEAMKKMVAEIDALPEGLEGYFSDSFADSLSKVRQAIEQAEKQDGVCQHCAGKGCVACDARKVAHDVF
jgi:hypothetical protein